MSEQEVAGKDEKYWARRCRRTIRPQQELLAALQAVMDKYAQKVHGMCLVGVRQDAADAADVRRDGQRAHPGGEGQHLR
jgi:acyl transferase domain-containing protein